MSGLPTPTPDSADIEAANAEGTTLMRRFGLQAGDPELSAVVTDKTPDDYLDSIWAAGLGKHRRLTAPAASNSNDPDDFYKLAEAEFRARHGWKAGTS